MSERLAEVIVVSEAEEQVAVVLRCYERILRQLSNPAKIIVSEISRGIYRCLVPTPFKGCTYPDRWAE